MRCGHGMGYFKRVMRERAEMESMAFAASDQLMESAGVPENWEANPAGAQALGTGEEDNVFSSEKISSLASMN